jgi:acyl-CoA thioester hydrolase
MKIRIYYEDTDAGGIVYHANYLKYCERARSEHFFANRMLPTLGEKSGFVVRDIQASFLATAKLGDMLEVTTKRLTLQRSSLTLLQEIWKEKEKVFNMEIRLVYLQNGKPHRIPEEFNALFETI